MIDPITIVAGSNVILGGASGVVSLVKKVFTSIYAENKLKQALSNESKHKLHNDFTGFESKPLSSAIPELNELRSRLDDLVVKSELQEQQKNLILDGLRQPSDIGKVRYARKLYESLAEADTSARPA